MVRHLTRQDKASCIGAKPAEKAQARLREIEQSFRLLFESNPVPMWLIDRERLRFVAVNRAAIGYYGYSRDRFLQMPALDIARPKDRSSFRKFIQGDGGGESRRTWRHRKAGGDIVTVSLSTGDLGYAAKRVRFCAVIDIADREQTENKLGAQKAQIDTAINNMSQGMLMFDADARLILCNKRYIEMYGLSTDVVRPGCTLRELVCHRQALGVFAGDVDVYCAGVIADIAKNRTTNKLIELSDGRTMHSVNQPLPDGGWVATHEDITERKKAQAQLARETNENKRLFETSLDLILVTDRQGLLKRVSPVSSAILGYAPGEMIGRNAIEFIYPADLESTRQEMRLARKGHTIRNFETRYLHKDGGIVTLAWSGVWSEPEQLHFFTGHDITQAKVIEQQLSYLAHYDQLTGLPNRVSLKSDLDEAIGSAPTCVAMFDLDGFKTVNNTLGHSTGDLLIREVAARLAAFARREVRFYRIGGDQFVLVQRNTGDPRAIGHIVDSAIKSLAKMFEVNGHQIFTSASAGIAIGPADGADADVLMSNADLALYDAKRAGGNTYRLFMPVLRARAQARRDLETELRRAYANHEFELYYQPQVRASDGVVVGAEALLRWRHPVRGVLSPGAFIDVLSESPISLEVGRWVLHSACIQAAEWRVNGFPIRMAVNLFPAQFRAKTLLPDVADALRYSGLPADALELEITENIALAHDQTMVSALNALRTKGVNLAFDDFGTGYASLSYLARYPLTRIKIDQSFVRAISEQSTAEETAIVRSIVAMAHNLGLEVTAEGVETADQVAFLRSEECEELQGFYYSKPLTNTELASHLRWNRDDAKHASAASLAG